MNRFFGLRLHLKEKGQIHIEHERINRSVLAAALSPALKKAYGILHDRSATAAEAELKTELSVSFRRLWRRNILLSKILCIVTFRAVFGSLVQRFQLKRGTDEVSASSQSPINQAQGCVCF